MKLWIKNMVCPRCVMSVQDILKATQLQYDSITLGAVELTTVPDAEHLKALSLELEKVGFEILDDKNRRLIAEMKSLLITKIQTGSIEEHFNLPEFIVRHLHKEYTQMSRLFSEVESITVEQFFILQKIEKVKEWLVYQQLTLSEISWKLGYSSVAHLSAQFKKVTGLTPSHFKKQGEKNRRSIDSI